MDKKDIKKVLLRWTQEGTKIFDIDGNLMSDDYSFDIVTAMIMLNQAPYRVNEIMMYLKDSNKKHNRDIFKILKDINLKLKGYEKNFAMYVLGKNFKYTFDKISKGEQVKYIIDLGEILSVERIPDKLDYFTRLIEELGSPPKIIQRLAVGNFKDNEIDFMILILGLQI